MNEHIDQLNQVLYRLELITQKQEGVSKEVAELKIEVVRLKALVESESTETKVDTIVEPVVVKSDSIVEATPAAGYHSIPQKSSPERQAAHAPVTSRLPELKFDLEKFIGENIISKIGIAITVIGVGIGAKNAIDNQLISPLVRIVLGYLAGFVLFGFAVNLKKSYESFSAILLSGSMAITYFITYCAYDFYGLFPQAVAFMLMVMITVFTVAAAMRYNNQVIAHIGLVGAYAVPFLLSDGSGNVSVLFAYMAIINVGILVIAFKRYWKSLSYAAFVLTWVIFFSFYFSTYDASLHFGLALTFLSIFFSIFYLMLLAYKFLRKEAFESDNILLLCSNSFVFFGLGYALIAGNVATEPLLGLFTLGNALIHFGVSRCIYRQRLADTTLFYMLTGLSLVFVTIAIPVQLDGSWVTVLWAAQAALMFWMGRTKREPVYEYLSYGLMVLAFISILLDWTTSYGGYLVGHPETRIVPLLNVCFLTSLLFIAAFGFICRLSRSAEYRIPESNQTDVQLVVSYLVPAILLFTMYFSLRIELATYWNQAYADLVGTIDVARLSGSDYGAVSDMLHFKTVWILCYSLLFFTILSVVNIKKIKSEPLAFTNLALNALVIGVFLVQGLYVLSELRESYLHHTVSAYYQGGAFSIGIRYVSFAFVAALLVACYKYVYQNDRSRELKVAFDCFLYVVILWIASSELISWMSITAAAQSYKLGLSILWGMYAFLLVALGIWKKKKHLRIGAIALFGVTLLKLFVYDISHLNTIAKTVVFVSLGILLLVISFLYNKYKLIISDEQQG